MSKPSFRSAFTLIELMVVVAIIAALLALSAGAAVKYVESQQISNTQSTLDRTQSALAKAWSKVKDQAFREPINSDTHDWIKSNLAGNDANSEGRIRVIYVKLQQRRAFPMNFNEALYPPVDLQSKPCPCSQLQPLPSYVTYLKQHGIMTSSGASWESSACLLMALQRGVSGAGINPESLAAGGAGSVDTSGYGIPILTDAWGRPIYFSRVPSGAPSLNPNGAQTGAHDPGDPQGYLQTGTWGTTYGGLFSSITQQTLAPTNSSFVLAPMVASQGPTRYMSVNPVTFAPDYTGAPMYGRN